MIIYVTQKEEGESNSKWQNGENFTKLATQSKNFGTRSFIFYDPEKWETFFSIYTNLCIYFHLWIVDCRF